MCVHSCQNCGFICFSVIVQEGQTPLHKASEEGYYKVVEVLLTAGADVNFADKVSCIS